MSGLVRFCDITVGWLSAFLFMLICDALQPPPAPRVMQTMQLENGHIVHWISEPRAECETIRSAIATQSDSVEVASPWGITYRVRRVWCGDYRPSGKQLPSADNQGEKA